MQISGLVNQAEGVALIDQRDLSRAYAERLLDAKYHAVINRKQSLSGAYPAEGARILLKAKVVILDNVGDGEVAQIADGDFVTIKDDWVYHDNHKVAHGQLLDLATVEHTYDKALSQIAAGFEKFVSSTAVYVRKSDPSLLFNPQVPDLRAAVARRHVLVVAAGGGVEEDLRALHAYLQEVKPFVIAEAPLAPLLKKLKINVDLFLKDDQNADFGLVCAYQNDAALIVSVGMSAGLADFIQEESGQAAEQLLTRIKVGDRLVDARGVSLLYHAAPSLRLAIPLLIVGVVIIIILFAIIPSLRSFWQLAWLNLRAALGF
ncbi:MAG: hypothetical protein LBL67_02870 [Coriobacteriales bacterium]|jgi:uncharacterized membrane-anchored protein|nr:hypothetical protein [Coriobacteriales bacterium]